MQPTTFRYQSYTVAEWLRPKASGGRGLLPHGFESLRISMQNLTKYREQGRGERKRIERSIESEEEKRETE